MIEIDCRLLRRPGCTENAGDAIITLGDLAPEPLEQTSGSSHGTVTLPRA